MVVAHLNRADCHSKVVWYEWRDSHSAIQVGFLVAWNLWLFVMLYVPGDRTGDNDLL